MSGGMPGGGGGWGMCGRGCAWQGACMAGKTAIPTGMHSCEKDLKCEGVSFAQ